MCKAQRAHADSTADIKAFDKRRNVGRGRMVSIVLCVKRILDESKSTMLCMASISDELGEPQ